MPIPKEKARQLVAGMEARIEQECNQSSREAHYRAAVNCAIVSIKELLGYTQEEAFNYDPYLEEVLDELNKL